MAQILVRKFAPFRIRFRRPQEMNRSEQKWSVWDKIGQDWKGLDRIGLKMDRIEYDLTRFN